MKSQDLKKKKSKLEFMKNGHANADIGRQCLFKAMY